MTYISQRSRAPITEEAWKVIGLLLRGIQTSQGPTLPGAQSHACGGCRRYGANWFDAHSPE
jgi:hypothetical protein